MIRATLAWRTFRVACLIVLGVETAYGSQAPPPQAPEVWAILIGINQYDDKAIPACPAAVSDAREIREWLVQTAGWTPRHVLLLQDAGQAEPGEAHDQVADLKPTRRNLEWAVTHWLGSRLKPNDIVLIYFSGQSAGLAPAKSAPAGSIAGALLLPIDARTDDLISTGWRLDDALDELGARGQTPVICWLDTSLQGGHGPQVAIPGADPAASATAWLGTLARWPGVSVWLSADGHPVAEAAEPGGRSTFVAALFKALGTARRPSNLLACLDVLNHDQSLQQQGFRTLGGIPSNLTLWSQAARVHALPERTLLLQRGHADRVQAVAFTADGSRMVTASWDSTVKIWRVADRVLLRTLPDYFHIDGVTGLALSPGSQWLASGDGSGRLRGWDLVEQKEKRFLGPSPHSRRIESLTSLPDGTHFVSVDQEGKSWLWDASGSDLKGKLLASDLSAITCASLPGPVAIAVAAEKVPIRLLAADGEPVQTVPGPGGAVLSLALSADGRLLAAGDEDGRVTLWDLQTSKPIFQHTYDSEITLLVMAPGRNLAVGTADALFLAALDQAGPGRQIEVPGAVRQAIFSPDGRWLAASTKQTGRIFLWRLDDPARPVATPLSGADRAEPVASSVAFAPDGRTLVAGGQDGGIQSWTLPNGQRRPGVPPRRGKVASLSVSNDRRYLLEITRDWMALVWDLKDGRGFTSLDGLWTSGAIAPDGGSLVLTSQATGDVFIIDRESGRARGKALPRPPAQGGKGPVTWRFGANNVVDGPQMLVISQDGRSIAACSSEGPLACVWDARSGRLLATIRDPDHRQPIAAIDLSPAGHFLLTADSGGTARLWDLSAGEGPARAVATFETPDEPIAAARLSPTDPRKIITGTRTGRVLSWKAVREQPEATLARLDGAVRALAFTPDGHWLGVAGADKSVRLVPMDRPREQVRIDREHLHAEQVNTLLAWPESTLLASGSDDTTVRFWSLTDQTLLGTISAVQETAEPANAAGAGGNRVGAQLESSWVAYTPEGLFDSSPGGERQVTWLGGDKVQPLEQFYDSCHVFGLCDWLRQGKRPPSPVIPRDPPPRLTIDPPVPAILQGTGHQVELTCSLSEPGLKNLRLYQNGVPVLGEEDLAPSPGQRKLHVTLPLRRGMNRFYLMASRPGSIDGRSNEVEIRYDGPDAPAQLHILALGISRYKTRALQFAHQDAQQIADFLHQHGAYGTGKVGYRAVLTDEQVTNTNVEHELRELQKRVRGRPQDTVVIFLAGHTDIRQSRFCLLLPQFRFPEGGPQLVASRGTDPKAAQAQTDDPETVLEYVKIYRNIARLGALQRLVIIDACQSEAVFDDPGVRLIRRYIEDGAQQARTSYILAARRGEPANEVAALRHGLLSYVLLRGMGDPRLEPVPQVMVFKNHPNADLDTDGVVTTTELRRFADLTLPELASQFPEVIERTGAGQRTEIVRPTANLKQAPRLQSVGSRSFPLVELPAPAR
ncbi:MAG TPA: WD40 repeat domain-containing protein [Isosphaeraceae bacterium]|nr:WD40 repeat domain-containing protein [Isosphaeraceae bacterium]